MYMNFSSLATRTDKILGRVVKCLGHFREKNVCWELQLNLLDIYRTKLTIPKLALGFFNVGLSFSVHVHRLRKYSILSPQTMISAILKWVEKCSFLQRPLIQKMSTRMSFRPPLNFNKVGNSVFFFNLT